MVGIFESKIPLILHYNLKKAESAAIQEAAITNSLIQKTAYVRIHNKEIYFIGKVNRNQFISKMKDNINNDLQHIIIQPNDYGNFHTSWKNILYSDTFLGFLIFQFPIILINKSRIIENDYQPKDYITISLKTDHIGESLMQKKIGQPLCENCGELINPKRINIVPETRYCVICMNKFEKGDYKNDNA